LKAIILAGGAGTRLAEETAVRPKPMVEIGGKPILWHIMNIYAAHGVREFIIALGYKGEIIKEYFLNFYALNNDLTVDLSSGNSTIHEGVQTNWIVHLVDTGENTGTAGRILRLRRWVEPDRSFLVTYGDGVGNVNINETVEFHRQHGRYATVTTVRPPARFGGVLFDGDRVAEFTEKPQTGEGWINGGFFVFDREVFEYIDGDDSVLEHQPLERLAGDGQLMAYRHEGFWQPMDTLRDRKLLEELWEAGSAPWVAR
jgi:glucose-1-phosphate cytidylyltransferase